MESKRKDRLEELLDQWRDLQDELITALQEGENQTVDHLLSRAGTILERVELDCCEESYARFEEMLQDLQSGVAMFRGQDASTVALQEAAEVAEETLVATAPIVRKA